MYSKYYSKTVNKILCSNRMQYSLFKITIKQKIKFDFNKQEHKIIQKLIISKQTYSNVALLNGFCRLPKYSPIICLLKPFLDIRNLATLCGEFSKNPLRTR